MANDGLYYQPPSPFIGAAQPLEPRKLTPQAAPVSSPFDPGISKRWQLRESLAWTEAPTVVIYLLPGVELTAVPPDIAPIISAGDPAIASTIIINQWRESLTSIDLFEPAAETVIPPIATQGTIIPVSLATFLGAWSQIVTPPPQPPIAARNLLIQGAVNPPIGRAPSNLTTIVNTAWIPPPRRPPIVAINLIPLGQAIETVMWGSRNKGKLPLEVLNSWLPPPPRTIIGPLPPITTPYPPELYANRVLATAEVSTAWIPAAPQPITTYLGIPISQDPILRGTWVPRSVLWAWLPPDPQPIIAIDLIPPEPPPLLPGSAVPGTILAAWIPPPPQAPVAFLPFPGEAPQTLFFSSRNKGRIPVEILDSWLPPAPQPITAINTLPPDQPIEFPTFGSRNKGKVPLEILDAWLPLPPRPIVASQVTPPEFDLIVPITIPTAVLDAWLPPTPQPIVTRPGFPGEPLPLLPGMRVPAQVLNAWLPPDPRAIKARNFTPPDQPLFVYPTPMPLTVLETVWLPPPPLPPTAKNLGPGAPDTVLPVFSARNRGRIPIEILDAWLPLPPQPPVAVNLLPPPPDNALPMFSARTRGKVPLEISNAWLPLPPQPLVAINLTPPEYTPLYQKMIPREVLSAWLPPDPPPYFGNPQPLTPFAPAPPEQPPSQLIGTSVPLVILDAWLPLPPQPPTAINILPPEGLVINYGRTRQNLYAILGIDWTPPPPQAPVAASFSQALIFKPDNPPLVGSPVPFGVRELWRIWSPPPAPPIVGPILTLPWFAYKPDIPPTVGPGTGKIETIHAWDQWLTPSPYFQTGERLYFIWNPVVSATTKFGILGGTTTITFSLGA